MTKPRSQKKFPWPAAILGAVGVGLIVMAVVFRSPKKTVTTKTSTVDTSAITIATPDGLQLSATIKYPIRNVQVPAVILLHEYGQDRHQWDPYIQQFNDAGYAVLSYDMRGFGASRLKSIPANQAEHLKSLGADVPAVISYLEQQPSINHDRISLIGASIGANVAFVAHSLHLNIYRTVLLSPVVRDGMETAYDAVGFSPQNILGIADDKEANDLHVFMKFVTGKKEEKIIPGGEHGMALLSQPGLLNDIIQWIK